MKPKLEELTLREKIGQTACFAHDLRFSELEDLSSYFTHNPIGVLWTTSTDHAIFRQVECDRGNSELKGLYEELLINYINHANRHMRIPVMPVMDADNGLQFDGHIHTLPTAASLGAANDPELAYRYGNVLGKDMHSMGLRWLWRPVADNAGHFTTTRVMSNHYESNKKLLPAFIQGLQDAGVAACGKHFPGSDPYEYRDSHFCTASISLSYEAWEATQRREFQACIDAGVASIMIGHSTFKAVDDTLVNGRLLPSTLSYKVITELLKEKMGFKGVVITDHISMKALTAIYPYEKLYVELLRAGNDMLLDPQHLNYIDIVEEAVLNGELPESRIDDACQRILDMKERFGLFEQGEVSHLTATQKETIADDVHTLCQDIAAKGITLTANRMGFLPIDQEKIRKVKMVYIGYSGWCYHMLQHAVEEFARHGAVCDLQEGFTDEDNITLDEYDLIVYATFISMHMPMGGQAFYGEKCNMMRKIMTVATEKSVGVSFGNPDVFFNYFTAAHSFVNCYSINPDTIIGFVKGLYGELDFTDNAPYPLNPITRTNDVY